jgi:hypothetical protein
MPFHQIWYLHMSRLILSLRYHRLRMTRVLEFRKHELYHEHLEAN